jgi:hypothetical protein
MNADQRGYWKPKSVHSNLKSEILKSEISLRSSAFICGSFLILFLCCGLVYARALAEESAREAAKKRLAPLQDFVGQWRGVGQRERGKTEGSWSEKSDWAWQFSGDAAAIGFVAADGKYLAKGAIQPGEKEGQFTLSATAGDGKTPLAYSGQREGENLVLTAQKPVEGAPDRISLRLVATGKRLVALYESKSTASERYTRLAEVGYTRVGSNFGQGSQGPECIVTGGLGSIAVTYQGKTYHVCCTGCRDYFNDNPAQAIEEYLAKRK